MKWVHYKSLVPKARMAIDAGDGDHYGFRIDGNHIAKIDKTSGRALDYVKVVGIKSNFPVIERIRPD